MSKSIVFLMGMVCFVGIANAAPDTSRRSMSSQMVMAAPRAVASKNQLNAMAAKNTDAESAAEKAALAVTPEEMLPADKDIRQKEKEACLANNIGVGNTYVWASRNSDTSDYATMVEDFVNPENNTCFIKVEIRTNDPRIDMSGVSAKYFEWNRDPIKCGGWVSDEEMEQRILDAKKSGRVWGTVGATVASAGLGFGLMEAGGNKIFGDKVMGQKELSGTELFKSRLEELRTSKDKDKNKDYESHRTAICDLKTVCEGKLDPECSGFEEIYEAVNCDNN